MEVKDRPLTEEVLLEITKSCLRDKGMMELIREHMKYQYLPTEEFKNIYKIIFNHFDTTENKPSYAVLSERIVDEDTRALLAKIKKVRMDTVKSDLLDLFERFIKRSRYIKLSRDVRDIKDEDEAYHYLANESQKILQLNIKTSNYSRVYADFDKRLAERRSQDLTKEEKIPIGLPQFDHNTRGGIEKGTALLGIARSGVGKSTALRWFGYSASKRGYRGVHFQAEGKKKQVEDAYDAMWTGIDLHDMKQGIIPPGKLAQIEKAQIQMKEMRGEIFVVAFEQFDTATIAQCRQTIIDLENIYGPLDFATWDYLELFDPGDGKRYPANAEGERMRKEATARKIVNVCTEFDLAGFTMTQASNIPKGGGSDKANIGWNHPEFVITREHISNLKATIDPFAYCITLNQTDDENDNNIMRIWEEKLREYKIDTSRRLYRIAQNRSKGRLVHSKLTHELFWDMNKKRQKHMTYEESITKAKNAFNRTAA